MPRVNRDLERRIAARRERERRRGTTPQYRFAPAVGVEEPPSTVEQEPTETAPATPKAERRARAAALRSAGPSAPPPRSFADYRSEYAYVASDLRRIVLVVGGLLVALILLSFVIRT